MELVLNTKTISNYTSLMKVLRSALIANWSGVTFTSTSPKISPTESVPTPIITYILESKEPGEMKNAKELKPRLRGTITVEDSTPDGGSTSGGAMEVWGQMFDYVIAFNIYGSSEDEADETADRFQQFMFKYTGYLKKLGVSELLFLSMRNSPEEGTRANLACRTIRYFIRLDEVVGIKVPHVEKVIIETDIYEGLERVFEFYGVDQYIADILNKNE